MTMYPGRRKSRATTHLYDNQPPIIAECPEPVKDTAEWLERYGPMLHRGPSNERTEFIDDYCGFYGGTPFKLSVPTIVWANHSWSAW